MGNKNAIGNAGGRPPFFSDPDTLEALCDEYFESIKEDGEYATITGLALYLGFSSRQSLYEYQKKIEFSDTIKRARLRVEHSYELSLRSGQPTGAIFALKNMDWHDKQEQEHSGRIDVPIIAFKKFSNE